MSHTVLTICSWWFYIWGPADPGKTIPPRASLFLYRVNNFPVTIHTFYMQANQSKAYTSTTFFMDLAYSGLLSTCPNHPGPGNRKLQVAPMPQSLKKLFKLHNPRPDYPASCVTSCGNHKKSSFPCFPLFHSVWETAVLSCMGAKDSHFL